MSEIRTPFDGPAGGWDALGAVTQALRREGNPAEGARTLLKANQPEGFDCPGCAWPDPRHTSSFEFCENGAKAVAWEATRKAVDPAFFAAHTVSWLREQSDHWLEAQGRLTHPLRYDAATDRYLQVDWDTALAEIAASLRALPTPLAAAFYTSGRTSNEAAFLYQLMVRLYGSNNLPDCSNLCHEATSIGLPQAIGVGKGTVSLDDFAATDLLLSFGHNPGTNHPRMLGTLRELARRGVPIVVINPLRERGLERFRSPKHASEMLTGGATELATHYLQPRVGSDHALIQGLMKRLFELDAAGEPVLDHAFLAEHCDGLAALQAELAALSWDDIVSVCGLPLSELHALAALYARSERCIIAYGMGITQHRHGTRTVQQLANLLLLRGQIGKAGAGICPVRGHSNVQGDRTMGINERPSADFLDRMERQFAQPMPRQHGGTVVETLQSILRGDTRALVALGGNFAVAAPDPERSAEAMARLDLVVGIHTKLNRSHLLHRGAAYILPCLARSDEDLTAAGPQFVSVEDSMSIVHASRGMKKPLSAALRSEPAIVAGLAQALLPQSRVPWAALAEDYDRIRDLIEATIPGFERYNERIRVPGGFQLPNAAAAREWRTASGRAQLLCFHGSAAPASAADLLWLTTIRSHDQYNTTIYGLDDRYRGVRGRRDVLFVNAEDLAALGLREGARVDLCTPDGRRQLRGLHAVSYPIARGSCAAYFPEATVLVELDAHDPHSYTPAYKSIQVRVTASG
ncbi:MAG: FdhF/YdeP family oxidoreductase [Lysobacterales bacterium]